jgi:hypothetical protein
MIACRIQELELPAAFQLDQAREMRGLRAERCAAARLKQLRTVEKHSDRAFVHQRDRHRRLKLAALAPEPSVSQLRNEIVVQLASDFGPSGGIERGPLAPTDVSVERELGDGKHLTVEIRNAPIHFALLVFENPQSSHLLNQVVGIGFGIGARYAEEHQETATNFADHFSFNADRSFGDALDNGTHCRFRLAFFARTTANGGYTHGKRCAGIRRPPRRDVPSLATGFVMGASKWAQGVGDQMSLKEFVIVPLCEGALILAVSAAG